MVLHVQNAGRVAEGGRPGQWKPRLSGNESSIWVDALAEGLASVVGVLVALAVDAWRRDSGDRKLGDVIAPDFIADSFAAAHQAAPDS